MTILLLAISAAGFAQNDSVASKKAERELTVYIQVKDHLTHDGIDSTLTGRLLNAADTSFVDTMKVEIQKWNDKRYSYATGKITKPGNYLIRLEADNYQTKYVELNIPKLYKREKYMELKTAYLRQQKKKLEMELDELVVTATKLKFYMDGDTLVYNADAFNLSEGSMIDALIKKLPGVEIKKGGEIFVNGQKVEALLLNGKDFFDSDRELMLENMPAYMVKNIQSYERVPESAKGTNKEKSTQKELVMNIKLKREYNKGWLFTAEGGLGSTYRKNTDGHYDTKFMGRLFSLRFSDKSRFMLFANVNNLNDDRTPGEKGEWSPLTQSQGLTETYKIGSDYTIGSWEHLHYHGSANASYKEKDDASSTNRETFLEGGNTYGRSFYQTRSYDVTFDTFHDFMYRTAEPKNWYKSIMFYTRPSFNYMKWNNNSMNASATLEQDVAEQLGKDWMDSIAAPNAGELLKKYAITRTISRSKGNGHWTQFYNYGYVTFTPAHNDLVDFSVSFSYNANEREDDTYDHYQLDYPNNPAAKSDFRNRYTPTFDKGQNLNLSPSFDFTLSSGDNHRRSIGVTYTYDYKYQNTNNSIYLLNKLSEWSQGTTHALGTLPSMEEMLTTFDTDNSSRSKSRTHLHTPNLNYSFVRYDDTKFSNLYLTLALPMKRETLDYWQGSQVDTLFSRNTTFLEPSIQYDYNNRSKGRRIRARYFFSSSAPSMTSLLNITNTTNPLFITKSNPNLRNTSTHNAEVSYGDKFGRGTLFNISSNATITEDAIASGRVYNRETGVTTSTPDNVNGNWNLSFNTGIDVPIDSLEKWRVKNNIQYSFVNSVDLNGETALLGGASTRSVVKSNYIDDNISVTYRPSGKMEFSAKGGVNYQHSNSDRQNFTKINVFDFNYGFTAQTELMWNIQLSMDLTMYSRRGYSDSSMNTNELVWNARLTKRLMKGNLLIHFDGFDLLSNLSNVRRTIDAQGKTETFYNVIPSYCLMHIAWKFNKSPKKKQ